MDTLASHWVRFGTFLLVEDAKVWWKTVLDIWFGGQRPTWEEFATQFRETNVSQVAREHREFLELAQSGRSVVDYAARFRYLQCYSPHLFASERKRSNRFVWGLRPRVMSSNPSTLLLAVEMATRMEEYYRRSQVLARKQKGLAPVASHFKKALSASKASRLPLAGTTASQRLLMSRPKVCYHCNQACHLWRDYPSRRDRAPSVTGSSPPTPQRAPLGVAQTRPASKPIEARRELMPAAPIPAPVPAPQRGRLAGRVYTTSLQALQSQDLIQGTLLLNEFFVRVLFDTGASHSFIARELATQLGSEVIVVFFALRIYSPLGERQIDVEYILVEGLYIEDRAFPAQLIVLDMTKFDVILGID
ncbi:unnamed protein product [Victoria cruziana]